ncbi:MAG: orotate phosphoribosyltransferase [Candidatus Methanospirareceae archaeon]
MDAKAGLMRSLYEIGAIKFGEFILKSGKRSSYYVDLRVLPSYPKVLREVGKIMADMIMSSDNKPDVLCGVPFAGLAIANAISFETNIPVVYVKKEPMIYRDLARHIKKFLEEGRGREGEKEGLEKALEIIDSLGGMKTHGIRRYVDGELKEGSKVGIVDDLITTAESKLEAIEMIVKEAERRGINVNVVGVYVLLDREEGGREALQKAGIKLYAVATMREVAKNLFDMGLLTKEEYKMIT